MSWKWVPLPRVRSISWRSAAADMSLKTRSGLVAPLSVAVSCPVHTNRRLVPVPPVSAHCDVVPLAAVSADCTWAAVSWVRVPVGWNAVWGTYRSSTLAICSSRKVS